LVLSEPLALSLALTQFLSSQERPDFLCMVHSTCCCFLLVSCLVYSSTLKLEAIHFPETSGSFKTTLHYNPDDSTIYSHLLT
jgi:hypothetical protein